MIFKMSIYIILLILKAIIFFCLKNKETMK